MVITQDNVDKHDLELIQLLVVGSYVYLKSVMSRSSSVQYLLVFPWFRCKIENPHKLFVVSVLIWQAIEERNYSCGIFLDFSKAFDAVNHKILLRKLERT